MSANHNVSNFKESSKSLSAIDTFPLASSPLVSTRFGILAYLAAGPASAPEIADALGCGRTTTYNKLVKDFEPRGWAVIVRRVWRITPAGMSELRRVYMELGVQLRNGSDPRTK